MRPTIILKSNRTNNSSQFHPWIYSGSIKSESSSIVEGTIVNLFSEDKDYLGCGYYCNEGSIKVRVLSRPDKDTLKDNNYNDQEIWDELIQNAINRRIYLGLLGNSQESKTTGFRIVNGEGDDLSGVILDYYDGNLVLDLQNNGARNNALNILAAIKSSSLKISNVILKGETTEGAPLRFKENNINFYSDPFLGQKTGFFLDQRNNRELLGEQSKNKNVLNCFSYSGGFSLYAIKGGAKKVVSVDSSKRALEILNENIILNGLKNNEQDNEQSFEHQAICEDVPKYLEEVESGDFDIIILDPPAYAKNLKAKESALRGYTKINRLGLLKIKKPGIIFTFSCSGVVNMSEFQEAVFHAARLARIRCKIIKYLSQSECHPINIYHPEGSYLKGLMLLVE